MVHDRAPVHTPSGSILAAVASVRLGAVSISFVNRDPAPDEPMPIMEDEADHIGERRARR